MAKKTEVFYGWWLSTYKGTMGSNDGGRPRRPRVGVINKARHRSTGRVAPQYAVRHTCGVGMHAAPTVKACTFYRAWAAGKFWPNSKQVLCRVKLIDVLPGGDFASATKRVAWQRQTLAMIPTAQLGGRLPSEKKIRAAFEAAGYDFSTEV